MADAASGGGYVHEQSLSARRLSRRDPDEAYLVKCDEETTTQADIDLGIVNIDVGFAPLKPAEFIFIRIRQLAGETEA